MKESQLNTIISNSLKTIGWAYKISDPMGGTGIQNPFDGFGVYNKYSIYWEAKLLKSYQAFNFKKIESHQLKNLIDINNILLNNCYTIIVLGIFESRKYFDVYFFDIKYIDKLIKNNKKSVLKKELLELKKQDMYLPIFRDKKLKKYYIDNIHNIYNKVIL